MDERMNIQSWWMLIFCSRLCFCCFMSSDSWPQPRKLVDSHLCQCVFHGPNKAKVTYRVNCEEIVLECLISSSTSNNLRGNLLKGCIEKTNHHPHVWNLRLRDHGLMVLVHWPFTWLIHGCMYVYTIVYQYIPIVIYSVIYTPMKSMKTMVLSEHGLGWAVPNSRGLLLHIMAFMIIIIIYHECHNP